MDLLEQMEFTKCRGEKEKFTSHETLLCKGIAILIMLFHHLFYRVDSWNLYWHKITINSTPLIAFIARQGKICVAFFVFITGYGLVYSYKKLKDHNAKSEIFFVGKRIWKLYIWLWPVLASAIIIGTVTKLRSVTAVYSNLREAFKDIFGIGYLIDGSNYVTYNTTWWYISFALVIYALFPLLYRIAKKNPKTILLITFIVGIHPSSSIAIFMELRRYLFVYLLGIIFAEYKVMNILLNMKIPKWKFLIITGAACVILFCIRCIIAFTFDGALVLAIMLFCIKLFEKLDCISRCLVFFGIHSGNIFLIHGLIFNYMFRDLIYSFYYPIIIYFVLLGLSLGYSIIIDCGKNAVDKFVEKTVA